MPPNTSGLTPYKPGAEWKGNRNGRPKKKPDMLTERVRALLEREPELCDALVQAWVVRAGTNPDGAAFAHLLDRLEGPVAREGRREIPSMVLNLQNVQVTPREPGISPSTGAEGTTLPGSNGAKSSGITIDLGPKKNGHAPKPPADGTSDGEKL